MLHLRVTFMFMNLCGSLYYMCITSALLLAMLQVCFDICNMVSSVKSVLDNINKQCCSNVKIALSS